MNTKHRTAEHYNADVTRNCEIALTLLLRSFGTLKDTIRLVGGLVPRYLAPMQPPDVPAHAGTTDVDVLLNVSVLAQKGTYAQLKDQLKANGFTRNMKDGRSSSWQWVCEVNGQRVVIEFLQSTDDETQNGRLASLDGEGVSAVQFLHAGIAHDWYEETEIKVEMPNSAGIASERVRYADPVAFMILKTMAFDHRREPKDVADLIHVMRYWGKPAPDIDRLAATYVERIKAGPHSEVLQKTLGLLEQHFCDEADTEGWKKEGPSMFANFHQIGEPGSEEFVREQRDVSGVVAYFIHRVRNQHN